MREKLERDRLIALVEQIRKAEGTEAEIDLWLVLIDQNVPAPAGFVSDLIFWPDLPGSEELSAAKIVDKALNYKPIAL